MFFLKNFLQAQLIANACIVQVLISTAPGIDNHADCMHKQFIDTFTTSLLTPICKFLFCCKHLKDKIYHSLENI